MDVEKLIALVFERPTIWNKAHPDHQNRFVISKLWQEVAGEMNLSRDNVQKKWKYLRDYFRNEATKIKPIRSGGAGNQDVSPCWPYYKQLLFLKDQIKNRNSTGNLSAKQQIETIEVGEDGEVEDAESVEVEEDRGIVEVEGVGREKELSSVAGETVVEPRVKLDSR
ncbi:hypothetical protein ANN_00471, partial [Periplaneta americana]